MNTGVASSTATGWMTSIVPTPGPHAATAPEPDEDRPDRPGHGGRAAQDLDQRIAAGHVPGDEDRDARP